MDRRACADLPALALQLLLAAHPDWKKLPACVVDADEPTGTLLWVNAPAWRARLRPGMRYASALALSRHLRAGTVATSAIETAVTGITGALRLHTPHVEPSREEPGVFWLDAGGLERLYTSVEAWARMVLRTIRTRGFDAHLAVGFTRFGTYALARAMGAGADARAARRAPGDASIRRSSPLAGSGIVVCESEEHERRLAGEVALERLGIDPKLQAALARLAVHTVADFTRLPAEGIRRRFGEEAADLHRRARGQAWDPLVHEPAALPLRLSVLLDDPVCDTGVVLRLVRRLLADLLEPLAVRGQAAKAVHVTLHHSLRRDRPPLVLGVSAAEPTLEEAVLADLVRLRLEAAVRQASPPAGFPRLAADASVVEIEVEIEAAPAPREQLRLFQERTRRDLAAGSRAIARLRAEFGEGSVVCATLRQGHLPEASYTWEPADQLRAPSPRTVLRRPLVRRIYERAVCLPPRPFRERDDSWIALSAGDGHAHGGMEPGRTERGLAHGRVDDMVGPFIVSGGWWNRELHREYHYARTEDGEILWVYYDRRRRRWFLAGRVE